MKNGITIKSSNGHLPKENENTNSKIYMHSYVYCSIIYNSQDMEAAQVSSIDEWRGAWVAQSIKCPTSAKVMILWSMSSSPESGSVLAAQSLEPASDSVSMSLSAPPPLALFSLSLSQK